MTENVKHVLQKALNQVRLGLYDDADDTLEDAIKSLQREAAGDGECHTHGKAAVESLVKYGCGCSVHSRNDDRQNTIAPRPTGTEATCKQSLQVPTPASVDQSEGDEAVVERVVTALDSVRSWTTPADYRRKLSRAAIAAIAQPNPEARGGGEAVALERWSVIADGTGGVEEFRNVSGRWVKYSDVKHLSPPAPAALDAEDGARYRWVRDYRNAHVSIMPRGTWYPSAVDLDAAIDAARATNGAE
jgi:hypothetical protein